MSVSRSSFKDLAGALPMTEAGSPLIAYGYDFKSDLHIRKLAMQTLQRIFPLATIRSLRPLPVEA